MKKYIFFLMLLWGTLVAQADSSVRFSPDTVALGESTQLIFESDQPIDNQTDLSGLTASFLISSRQQGSETRWFNGHHQARHTLLLTVFPRRAGRLSTGPLTLNGQPLPEAVLHVEQPDSKGDLPVAVSAKVNVPEAYPDQMILLMVRLTSHRQLLDAKIIPPVIKNAKIELLDRDQSYRQIQAGQPVYVFERVYAVTAEKEGTLLIAPFEIYGAITDTSAPNPGDLFARGILFNGLLGSQKDIRLESDPIRIQILPKPTDWQGWWLPATQVSLTADDDIPDTLKVGDSFTRRVVLSATGVTGEQLPPLTQSGGVGLKVYPSPEHRENLIIDGDIQGRESTSFVFVPTQAGQIIVPAIRVTWLNTKAHRVETAIVPEKKITVLPGEKIVTPTIQAPLTSDPETKKEVQIKSEQLSLPTNRTISETSGYILPLAIMAALAIGFSLGFFLFWWRHPRTYHLVNGRPAPKRKKKKSLPDLYPF